MPAPFFLILVLGPLLAPLGASAQQRADRSDLTMRRAQKLFVRGMTQSYLEDHEEAVAYFEKALEVSPGEPAILMALAEAEAARDNLTSALYYARQAREGAPKPYYAHQLAALLEKAGRPQEAAATYRTLLTKFPGYNEVRLPFARLQAKLNQPKKALATYEAFVDSVNRPAPVVYTEMLNLYEEIGDEQGLERTLQTLIDRRRSNRSYRRRLAELYVKQDRFAEAIPLLEILVRETPNNPQLLSRLEQLYDETGRTQEADVLWDRFAAQAAAPDQLVARARSLFEEARRSEEPLDSTAVRPTRQLLRKALAEDSTHVGALDLLGSIHYEVHAYASATQVLNRALDLNPRDAERWERASAAHLRAGHPQRALSTAEEGLLLFPGRADLLKILGFARLRLNDHEVARSHFQKALDSFDENSGSDEKRAALLAGLGLAENRIGNADRSKSAFERALSLDSQEPTALRFYARTLARQESNLDRALTLANRAVEQSPGDPRALGTLGRVHFKRGAFEEARSAFQRAVDTERAPAQVYEQFGDLHRALGNDRLARRYWQKALDHAPDGDSLQKKLDALPQS